MSDYIIVLAHSGMSGNFLMRLLNFSRAIEWAGDRQRSHEIVSKVADDQYINYCWTSHCHEAVNATSHKLAHHWYKQARWTTLDMNTWHAIKKASGRPTAWFFHKISNEVREDIETIIVQIKPGNDFDIPMLIDRRFFNGDPEDFNNNWKTANDWFKACLTSIKSSIEGRGSYIDKADIVINNRDIFDVVKVLELMKELNLYHNGLREIITDWIKVYLLKNKRPEALFSKSQPDDYRYKEQVNKINDPHIRHLLMCVNRKVWPTLDLIDDPYSYLIDFRKELLAGTSFAVAFNKAEARFNEWLKLIET